MVPDHRPQTQPLFASSGNPALDRRLDWARADLEAGDAAAAAELLTDTVGEAPGFVAAWFLLGEARQAAGDTAGAADAFRQARDRDPADALGAGLRLAQLGATAAEDAMSPDYVRTLFDQYAPRFDTALRDKLAYRGPEVLAAAVDAVCAARGRPARFARALDLGCGTGLAAPLFADKVEVLDGVDLSPAMVERAEALGLYARLEVGEMGAALEAVTPGSLDLVLAADALCYVGDLGPIFRAAQIAMASQALFAFTVETHAGEGLLLRETLRYAHAEALVRSEASAAGLAVLTLEPRSTRTEKGAPVPGLVAVLARSVDL
ncbi:class I SAM-dependent DNA methyltransferase [Azorhizobium oxalatiphilum]|uniref:class I SAM-dependent DNA methyltransferase n=1 Tax=Azorhizobium oxalatiphilum TaxID=980631 RepID=UPI001FCE898A|nr:methyltransferase domain-containing protein [Azorhizobium oxalatiphilum]